MPPESNRAHPPDAASSSNDRRDDWREYEFFRNELRHEDILINHRVSWLISSQAFLLGAFAILISAGSAVQSPAFHDMREFLLSGLPVAGILGVSSSYVSILGAILHVRGVRRYAAQVSLPNMPSIRSWHSVHLHMGQFGPLITPLIFLSFWVAILVKMR